MSIDPATAADHAEFDGLVYHFWSATCHTTFTLQPLGKPLIRHSDPPTTARRLT